MDGFDLSAFIRSLSEFFKRASESKHLYLGQSLVIIVGGEKVISLACDIMEMSLSFCYKSMPGSNCGSRKE